jgi:hypothetical protein
MRCGYNLRGLDGDPRRCPECGHGNPVSELLIPADRIRRQLRRLESAPTLCFSALLLAGFGLMLTFVSCNAGFSHKRISVVMTAIGAICVLSGLALWPMSARRFANSCVRQDGWKQALLNFHLYAVVIFVVGHAAAFGTVVALVFSVSSVAGFGAGPGVLECVLGTVAIWLFTVFVIRRVYRRLRRELMPLQRVVAIQMYQQELLREAVSASSPWPDPSFSS